MSMNHTAAPLFETTIKSLPLIHKGKVRDIYAVDDDHMLIVTTDRLSAFDVVLPTPIPGKGQVLTAVSAFWFGELMDIIDKQISWTPTPIHRTDVSPSIEKAIFKAMEKAPENRFQSIKAFWQALQAAGEPAKTGALPSQEEKTLSIKPPRNQNTILIVMALIILALVLLLVLR